MKSLGTRFGIAAIATASVLFATLAKPSVASAQAEWGFSPGLRLAWSPTQRMTYGFEVSFVRLPDLQNSTGDSTLSEVLDIAGKVITRTYGLVFAFETNFHEFRSTRLSVEWVGPFLGLELGPALVRDSTGRHVGLGLTAWVGYSLYASYTHTFVRGSDDVNQYGALLKTPLLAFRRGDELDFDDDD